MSKDFDTTLSDALDLAAQAAQTPGPAAARIRGRKRTMRRRIALSAASLVVVAVGATVAFKVASTGGGSPRLTGGSPHATVSASTPATSATGSPTAASGTATTGVPAPGSAASGPDTSSPASSGPALADPHHVVEAAWLSASELPFAGSIHWKPVEPNPGGQQLTPTVSYLPNTAGFQALTTCLDPAKLLQRTIGLQDSEFTSYTSAGNYEASQYVFFFADQTAALQTYAWMQSQYVSSCPVRSFGAEVTKTAGDGATEASWLALKGTSHLPDLALYMREYFVVRGSTIAYVSVTSYPDNLSRTYDDASQLSTIAAHMCVYGGSCD